MFLTQTGETQHTWLQRKKQVIPLRIVRRAYAYCEKLTQKHSSSFYRAFRLLPTPSQQAIWAVYAFCRTIDDLVDQHAPAEATPLLDGFALDFDAFCKGDVPDGLLWIALADTFGRYDMQKKPFDDMVIGQRQDIVHTPYATIEALDHYGYLVAGTVGLMILPILSPNPTNEMATQAIRLGQAMQLTNILRDVAEDYRRGRVYLPTAVMQRYGYDPETIPLGTNAPGWSGVFMEMVMVAQAHYEAGIAGSMLYPRESQLSLLAASSIYRAILDECVHRRGDVFRQRVRISHATKMKIVTSLLANQMTLLSAEGKTSP